MASLAATRAAQVSLKQHLAGQPWLRGIGIAQSKCIGPDPYAVQINVDTAASASLVPRSWLGVPVTVTVVGAIAPLGSLATPQDAANVFIGFAVLFGTLVVGKIAVESIIEARREHFERGGQSPAAVESKETTMDGIVKLVAFGLSVNELVTEGPGLLDQLRKILTR